MAKKIKLMTDYDWDPLWWEEPDIVGDIAPESLPLSQNTIARLHQWANHYNARLNWNDPSNLPIPKPEKVTQLEIEVINLWQQLRQELIHHPHELPQEIKQDDLIKVLS